MKIALRTLASLLFGVAFFAVLLFWPAGTLNYWQAWVFIAVFIVTALVPSSHFAVKDPAALLAVLVVSALDHRFGWSHVTVPVIVVGNILVAVGLGVAQLVIVQNSYAGATITVEADQKVVSTGLYGVVRHPMYAGTLIMMIGTPPALDSYWGLLAVVLILPVLAARIDDEEKMLRQELDGYDEYTQKVHYRLVPGVW
jgi:protein-S-isoprenylcysteine O-methyltransferase Ste14